MFNFDLRVERTGNHGPALANKLQAHARTLPSGGTI